MIVHAEEITPESATGDGAGEKQGGPDRSMEFQRQETLLKTGALQDAIFNSAYFSCIATDEKGVIQIFNVGAERMLGYAGADVVNRITPAELSDPQELIARARALSLEFQTPITPGFEALVFKASRGIEDIYELTKIRKDGSRFPAIVSVTALRDAQESVIGYLLIGTDNTAGKQVEADRALLDQRLRDQQFYTRSLIESNIDALMTTDPRGVISDVNQQMIALTGRTRDELIGAPCRNFFTDPLRADAAIKLVLSENKVSNYELTVRALNGEETAVSYNAATFHDRERKLQGVFAAARDVTELKRFERALQEKKELEHASRMKTEFLATMSHELRTPLNAIIGFSEALKDGLVGEMSDVQQEYIGDIFSSGQHLLSLINDILDLSKVEAGMMKLELEEVDLNSLLSNSLSIVREKAAAQRIHLELETGEDLGLPQLDMRKTKQIVYNLLSNAVKFSASGGRVTLRARRVSRSTVGTLPGAWPVYAFPLADNGYSEFLEICVSDNGIGISRDNMAKLFQAFSQIDSSLSRKFEGTGLGLAMVKQLAELHGGAVAVASAEGEGARFAAWLPLRMPAQTAAIPAPGAGVQSFAAAKPDERIALVVEHDDRVAELIRVLLKEEGFSVLRAATAEAALLLAPQQTISLIAMDFELPGADAWEFLQQIR
jgi:PAS domain S-box-containing protein